MTNKTQNKKLMKRADEVKLVLRALITKVETAETEAADTAWWDEKTNILESALVSVGNRCHTLGYDLTHWDTETVLTRSDLV